MRTRCCHTRTALRALATFAFSCSTVVVAASVGGGAGGVAGESCWRGPGRGDGGGEGGFGGLQAVVRLAQGALGEAELAA